MTEQMATIRVARSRYGNAIVIERRSIGGGFQSKRVESESESAIRAAILDMISEPTEIWDARTLPATRYYTSRPFNR
jgi:hypothetical protein